MRMGEQGSWDIHARQPPFGEPLFGIFNGLLDQQARVREIIRRDAERTQARNGEDLDLAFADELLEVSYELMGNEQRQRVERAGNRSLRRCNEIAGKAGRQHDDAVRSKTSSCQHWRVAGNGAVEQMMLADPDGRKRRGNSRVFSAWVKMIGTRGATSYARTSSTLSKNRLDLIWRALCPG